MTLLSVVRMCGRTRYNAFFISQVHFLVKTVSHVCTASIRRIFPEAFVLPTAPGGKHRQHRTADYRIGRNVSPSVIVWSSRCILPLDEAEGEEGPGRELVLEAWSSLYRCRELVVSAGELVCEDEDCESGRSREMSFSRSMVLPTS